MPLSRTFFSTNRDINVVIAALGLDAPIEAHYALLKKIEEFEDAVVANGVGTYGDAVLTGVICEGKNPLAVYSWDITKADNVYTCAYVEATSITEV